MRARCAASVLLVALSACGSSSAASHDGTSGAGTKPVGGPGAGTQPVAGPGAGTKPVSAPCAAGEGKTLLADSQARIYALGGMVYGCVRGARHGYRLGSSARSLRGPKVGPIALAGKDAAYGSARFGVDTGSAQVLVRDLASGRELHAVEATTTRFVEAVQSVAAIVVRRDGAVAWISEAQSIISRGKRAVEVQRIDARGRSLLDTGPGIDPRSLRLFRSTLTWRDGSSTRSATLR